VKVKKCVILRCYRKDKFGKQTTISLTIHEKVAEKEELTDYEEDVWETENSEEKKIKLKSKFIITDLPGDANYRGKWIQYYNNVDSIIFDFRVLKKFKLFSQNFKAEKTEQKNGVYDFLH